MSKKRSDALQALIVEAVDVRREIERAREVEGAARTEFTFARQQLDIPTAERVALEARETATREAITIIQGRDDVSDDVVAALIAREGGRS